MSSLRVALKTVDPVGRVRQVPGQIVPLNPKTHLPLAEKWLAELRRHAEEDASWSWREVCREARINEQNGVGRYEEYALLCRKELQALMQIEVAAHRSQRSGAGLVYVEYVSVAPWNRRSIQDPPQFAGCGTVIISMAVKRSIALGFGGVIGLHSLQGAEGFYRRMGMNDFGPDKTENGHRYFESP